MKFKRLVANNFSSWGHLDIDLENRGLVYIQGDNGSGKSSIFNALLWANTGDDGKDIVADGVVNNRIGKDCYVESYWDNSVVKVGRKPTFLRYVKDGKDLTRKTIPETRALITNELGMSREALKMKVLITDDQENRFLALTPSQRKRLLEQFIWIGWVDSCMKESKALITKVSDKLHVLSGKVQVLQSELKSSRLASDTTQTSSAKRLVSIQHSIKELEEKQDALTETIELVTGKNNDLRNQMAVKTRLVSEIKGHLEMLKAGKAACPTCLRPLSRSGRRGALSEQEWNLQKYTSSLVDLSKLVDKKTHRIEKLEDDAETLDQSLSSAQMKMSELEKVVYADKRLFEEKQNRMEALLSRLGSIRKKRSRFSELLMYYEECKDTLFPEIKGMYYEQAIQSLNTVIESEMLYYEDISFELYLDKKGDIAEEVHYKKGGKTYGSLSKGEKCCLDVAVAMALQTLAFKGGDTNLLMIDEVFKSFDAKRRVIQALELLKAFGRESVFVIEHRDDIVKYFPHVWQVTRKKGFSALREVS